MSAARFAASAALAVLRLLVPLAIIAAALIAGRFLLTTRSAPERAAERTPAAAAVETVAVSVGPREARVVAYGTVQPAREITLRPEVGGRIVELHPDLIAGGRLASGDALLRIDPREYEYRVTEQEAAVVRAEFDLQVEQGRGVVARREWELLEDSVQRSELGERLARREPHLEERMAAVEAARSRLEKARLDLERTELLVPFNALVLDESVERGQLVNAQTPVATLIGTDVFHVRVSVPMDRLGLVSLPGPGGEGGSPVLIHHDDGSVDGAPLPGRVVRLLGDVDPNGRMARLLVEVVDPLGLSGVPGATDETMGDRTAADGDSDAGRADDRSPLLVGEFVRVEILGPERDGLAVIPRRSLREGGRVWIMDDSDRLEIRPVTVAWGTDASLVVSAGLRDGDRVVTTPLAAPVPGMPLTDVTTAGEPDVVEAPADAGTGGSERSGAGATAAAAAADDDDDDDDAPRGERS